jgi:hypothetical protein
MFSEVFFRAISITKTPVIQALYSGPILMNKRVSGRVGLVFTARGSDLQVG